MFWSTVPLTGMPGTVAQSHGGLISFEQTRTIENLNYFYPKEKPTQPQELMVFPKLISPPPWQPGNYHSPKDFHLDLFYIAIDLPGLVWRWTPWSQIGWPFKVLR